LIPTPIQSALTSLRQHRVETLLLGGQASILYGGAEFSRDLDLMVAAAPATLPRLEHALHDLEATLIAVPPLRADLLEQGHAVHFRCGRPDVAGLRLDLMTRPPRLPDIEAVWDRRVEIELDIGPVTVVALEDLIQTKKTQRDKDWAIIGALVQADMIRHHQRPDPARIGFWLREGREAAELISLAATFPDLATPLAAERPVVASAQRGDRREVEFELAREQIEGKQADRDYWRPLQRQLEQMRHDQRRR
jgi:hypothetical protein